ncbi:MAG: hypothetical protein B6I22_01985 [Desulfobacteraceae bacterium 4572_123]|nr:MAG: hypothetical protein B6I22_01985 [Desulfobacteraceae bacterium 4572_123]
MNILVAYNGSDEAKAALELAKDYAKIHDSVVHIITSMEGGPREKLKAIKKSKEDLKYAMELVKASGIECEGYQTSRGLSPGEDIIRYAEEYDIKHIFVGIEKKSRTRKLLLGSTAQYIILRASCPVTTIH